MHHLLTFPRIPYHQQYPTTERTAISLHPKNGTRSHGSAIKMKTGSPHGGDDWRMGKQLGSNKAPAFFERGKWKEGRKLDAFMTSNDSW